MGKALRRTTSTYIKDRFVPTTLSRLLAFSLLTVVLGGCGAPPELEQQSTSRPSPTAAPPATVSPGPPTGVPLAPPTALPTTPDSSGMVATPCRNGPSGQQVLRLVRDSPGALPGGSGVRVRSGPLCADDWQYTVLTVSGYEDLSVVTRGRPGSLRLVTAGTDVCTIEVRTAAPTGIRTLTCDGTGGMAGA
ncbi:hypothetical protein GA0074692_5217 [Micromonospora pallida]|uniref:Uncharacterized protein n=1 Tax=Micromonospora pallida TaxID=145854 RepID=A0A1C6TB40_9ACTN|nr:hypothetical protein [Micromonospora pallida]SCL39026.1 hypothetical protein GA0074692_5217 [Micromonospora pallida]